MTNPKAKEDVPISMAIFILLIVGVGYYYLNYLRFDPVTLDSWVSLLEQHSVFFCLSIVAVMMNLSFFSVFIKRSVGLERQGSKLAVLQGKSGKRYLGKVEVVAAFLSIVAYIVTDKTVWGDLALSIRPLMPPHIIFWSLKGTSLNLAVSAFLILRLILNLVNQCRFGFLRSHKLELPEVESGELVLGTTPGELSHESRDSELEEWVKIPGRGVSGGLFISGSIGSGKTQGTILRYLRQILSEKKGVPPILAIDPKGTFLKEAERIIRKMGHGDRIVRISLKGNESFNPVYLDEPLKESKFSGLSEMVRAAAVNFMGKSSDSPFWDISSSHLIKNTIAYCAARPCPGCR